MLTTVQTPRLVLVPFSAERIASAITDKRALEAEIAAKIPDDWPGPDLVEAMPMLAAILARWGALVIDVADATLVGDVGFKSAPSADGTIEIGYAIVRSRRRRGYATEAVRALSSWALSLDIVTRVVAECEPDNVASMGVLEKAGFSRVKSDGPNVRFALEKGPR